MRIHLLRATSNPSSALSSQNNPDMRLCGTPLVDEPGLDCRTAACGQLEQELAPTGKLGDLLRGRHDHFQMLNVKM
jgi:hypothetical protein